MHSEEAYLDTLREGLASDDHDLSGLITLADEAVGAYPKSCPLRLCLGDALFLSGINAKKPEPRALECYKKASTLDPTCVEAWEGIGYYLDVCDDDLKGAEKAFRKAIELGGTPDCFAGLARVVAQLGRADEALELLRECPYTDDEAVGEMIEEIEEGVWDRGDDEGEEDDE